jgi:hypothetical protein
VGAVIPIYLETGSARVFAGALDWPGWCRSGRTDTAAIDTLLGYRERYAAAIGARGGALTGDGSYGVEVVERLTGGAGTDFGAPGEIPEADASAIDAAERTRLLAILQGCWRTFDAHVEAARGVDLRLGPRGGGRDLDKIRSHVLEAEQAYLAKLGSRPPKGDGGAAHLAKHRKAVRAAFTARAGDRPPPEPNLVRVLWSPRYFARRAAWHVLDHAWEIEDRATPE